MRGSTAPTISSVTPEKAAQLDHIEALKEALLELGPTVSEEEADCLAQDAFVYSAVLANAYHLTKPPLFHNILVNLGIKKRGLCIHWTRDLLLHFMAYRMRSFQFHWGVAYQGSLFREHSSVVVTTMGQDFDQGLVLDAWRNSGRLFWGPVKTDKYPWKEWNPHKNHASSSILKKGDQHEHRKIHSGKPVFAHAHHA